MAHASQWWNDLPAGIREEILRSPSGELGEQAVARIRAAHGSVVPTPFFDSNPNSHPAYQLSHEDEEWVRAQTS